MVKKCCLATFVVLSVASGGTVSADLPPVPEAVGGFRSPVDFAPSSAGYRFAQKALKKDKDGKWGRLILSLFKYWKEKIAN